MNQQISLQNTGTISIFQLQKAQSTKSKENQTNQSNKKLKKVILKRKKTRQQYKKTEDMQQCQKANQLLLQLDYVKYNIAKNKFLSMLHVTIIQT